jgi:hypothetical protein
MMKATSILLALLAAGLQNLPRAHAFSAVPRAISNKGPSAISALTTSARLSAISTSVTSRTYVPIPDPAPVLDDRLPPAIPKLSFKWMPVSR